MRDFLRLASLILVVLLPATAKSAGHGEGLLVPIAARTPYLERIAPEEFLAIEHLLGESDSDSSDLVIYLIGSGTPVRRWQLRPSNSAGKDIRHSEGNASSGAHLSAELADSVMTSFELALTKHVYPISNDVIARFKDGKLGERTYLVYLKKAPHQIAAGLVEAGSCVTGQTNVIPFLDAVFALYGCCEREVPEEDALESLKVALDRLRAVSLNNFAPG